MLVLEFAAAVIMMTAGQHGDAKPQHQTTASRDATSPPRRAERKAAVARCARKDKHGRTVGNRDDRGKRQSCKR